MVSIFAHVSSRLPCRCCDGGDCRKTFHLKCLNPPLEEVPTDAFFCPSCLAEASTRPGVEVVINSVVEDDIKLHRDDVSRYCGYFPSLQSG